MQVTQIPKDDLKPALIGLSMVKGKALLKKSPAGKDINDGDVFSFNEKFDSKLMKIKFAAAGGQKEVRPSPSPSTATPCPAPGALGHRPPASTGQGRSRCSVFCVRACIDYLALSPGPFSWWLSGWLQRGTALVCDSCDTYHVQPDLTSQDMWESLLLSLPHQQGVQHAIVVMHLRTLLTIMLSENASSIDAPMWNRPLGRCIAAVISACGHDEPLAIAFHRGAARTSLVHRCWLQCVLTRPLQRVGSTLPLISCSKIQWKLGISAAK